METKKELTLTRIVGAPRELVFKAWTDEELLKQWWGPRGFTTSECSIDAKVGGGIRIVMKGMDGVLYPMEGNFTEIVAPERLMFSGKALVDGREEPLLETLNTVTLEDFHGMTRMIVHIEVVKSNEEANMALAGMEQGWAESLYKLADALDKMIGGD